MAHQALIKRISAILDRSKKPLHTLDKEMLLDYIRALYDYALEISDAQISEQMDSAREASVSKVDKLEEKLDKEALILESQANELREEDTATTKEPFVTKDDHSAHEETTLFNDYMSPHEASISSKREMHEDLGDTSGSADDLNESHNSETQWNDDIEDFNSELSYLFDIPESNELSNRLASTPISNLKQAIGINDRLLFTKVLFNGKDPEYQEVIGSLNELTSFKSAKEILYPLMERNAWNSTRKEGIAKTFIQLVRRRYA